MVAQTGYDISTIVVQQNLAETVFEENIIRLSLPETVLCLYLSNNNKKIILPCCDELPPS